MTDPPKRAAIDLDEMGSKRLTEITAAEFLQALEQAAGASEPAPIENATVGDVLVGARVAIRLPEKKKVELEKQQLEKLSPEKTFEGFPEKKKVELEKPPIENFPEKKKLELEKPPGEHFPEKKKVELEKPDFEKQSIERPDVLTHIESLGERLDQIEQQLSRLSP